VTRITKLEISDVLLVAPRRYPDSRGYFTELYNAASLADAGARAAFVQDNLSLSTQAGTIRGLHFQGPPHAQAKLVRVSRGRILDVALDLRTASPTYRRHVAVEISSENGLQIYIPEGFAHGFCTLEADTEVVYKVSSYYAPHTEGGILWSDPELKIDWPVEAENAIVSDKDKILPTLRDLAPVF
jgi:dTDP-4-dehydrorhamnose 3,5-epimerase